MDSIENPDFTAVLDFWFGEPGSPAYGASRAVWFEKDAAFDEAMRRRFAALHGQAVAGALDGWRDRPESCLALILLLDQFSRNLYRDDARAFAADSAVRRLADHALALGFDEDFPSVARTFFHLPFEHSEDLDDQRRSLALAEANRDLAEPDYGRNLDYARRHYEIVARFGRFPHRNAALGRADTPEETEFLKQPGSGF